MVHQESQHFINYKKKYTGVYFENTQEVGDIYPVETKPKETLEISNFISVPNTHVLLKDESGQYTSGKCNIGPVEIKRRYRIGYIGLILMILFILIAEIFGIPGLWKLLIFIPAYYSFSGFIQARKKFCYVYGYKGVYSLKGRQTFTRVSDEDSVRADRKTVFEIVSMVIAGSAIVTAVYYYLSNFF